MACSIQHKQSRKSLLYCLPISHGAVLRRTVMALACGVVVLLVMLGLVINNENPVSGETQTVECHIAKDVAPEPYVPIRIPTTSVNCSSNESLTVDVSPQPDFTSYMWVNGKYRGPASGSADGWNKSRSCYDESCDNGLCLAVERLSDSDSKKVGSAESLFLKRVQHCNNIIDPRNVEVTWRCSNTFEANWQSPNFDSNHWNSTSPSKFGHMPMEKHEHFLLCRLEYNLHKRCKAAYTGGRYGYYGGYAQHMGGVTLYTLGMLMSFVGLAIVCDECFVPSLNMMCLKAGVSGPCAVLPPL